MHTPCRPPVYLDCALDHPDRVRALVERTAFLKIEVETKPFWEGQKLVGHCLELCERMGLSPCAWFDHEEQFDVILVNPRQYAS